MFKINELVEKKANLYKKMLYFVNFPLMAFIPFALESGMVLSPEHAIKADKIYMLLWSGDFLLLGNTMVIYTILRRLVTSVSYRKDDDVVELKTNSAMLRETTVEMKPADLIKCKRQGINPFIGYRSVEHAN